MGLCNPTGENMTKKKIETEATSLCVETDCAVAVEHDSHIGTPAPTARVTSAKRVTVVVDADSSFTTDPSPALSDAQLEALATMPRFENGVIESDGLGDGGAAAQKTIMQEQLEQLALEFFELFGVRPMAHGTLFDWDLVGLADRLESEVDNLHAMQHARAAAGNGTATHWQNAQAHIRKAIACIEQQAEADGVAT